MKTATQIFVGEKTFLTRVFGYFSVALFISGFVAFYFANFQREILLQISQFFWILAVAQIGVVFFLAARIQKISTQTAFALFVIYATLTGFNLGAIFFAFTAASIAKTFFICGGVFASMAIYGATTEADLSQFRQIFFFGILGLIFAGIVNIFLGSTLLEWISSIVGVFIFTGLIAHDAQKLQNLPREMQNENSAIYGALQLYLDFINLFLYLLRFFGSRD